MIKLEKGIRKPGSQWIMAYTANDEQCVDIRRNELFKTWTVLQGGRLPIVFTPYFVESDFIIID